MTRDELVEFCLGLPGVFEDWPFGEDWLAVRHKGGRKSCAFIYQRGGRTCLNLKCEPMQADFWRQLYADVAPAYHMNKVHWNTVALGGDVPDDELRMMIWHSHGLTAPKTRRKKGKQQKGRG